MKLPKLKNAAASLKKLRVAMEDLAEGAGAFKGKLKELKASRRADDRVDAILKSVKKSGQKLTTREEGAIRGIFKKRDEMLDAADNKNIDEVMNDELMKVSNKVDAAPPIKGKGIDRVAALKVLLVAAAIGSAAAVVLDSFVRAAELEKAVCLANWATLYHELLTDEAGALIEIDTPQEWTSNIKRISAKLAELAASDGVDPDARLKKMAADLTKCLEIDTTVAGAAARGAVKLITDSVSDLLGAAASLVTPGIIAIISIACAALVVVTILVFLMKRRSERVVRVRTSRALSRITA
jgi:hypothetical protein